MPATAFAQSSTPTPQKPLRLWPGVAGAVLVVLSVFVVPMVLAGSFAMLGAILGGLTAVLWWLFFSRAPWAERLVGLALAVAAAAATSLLVDPSISNGMMGMMLPVFSIPVLGVALVVGAVASRRLSSVPRLVSMVVAILIGCGLLSAIRTGGLSGDGASDLHWRWTPTPEELLLASGESVLVPPAPVAADAPKEIAATPAPAPAAPAAGLAMREPGVGSRAAAPAAATSAGPAASELGSTRVEWPGFRGPDRDSAIHGVRIETDWAKSPPKELWRRPIGPGWSSFSVHGDLLYTQEQRGEDEIVACYKVSTGEPVWRHSDPVRFWESNGGAGPRATPTLTNGRVYAFGATGILNVLDARTGASVWARNVGSDTQTAVPEWGFASSPLVVGDIVIVAASGTLAAYDVVTGKQRWIGPHHEGGYSSPQLLTIDGVQQVLLLSAPGAVSVAPADGALLWQHAWEGNAIVQPGLTAEGDVLINTIGGTGGNGMRRLAVKHQGSWTATESWTSSGLKPYFNDFVVHKGHAYGFDGNILSSIDLADGRRKWKGGRYGAGQLVLLADQDVLLVISEEGELALVAATPDKFTELAKFPALDAKTWNHPVLVGDVLLVRNGEEMAAFRLALQAR